MSCNVPNFFYFERVFILGKLLDIYNKNKLVDNDKKYLFKGGIFYYFISDDAKYMSDKYGFKLTTFGNTVKCGFPVDSLEKYLYIFSSENILLIDDVSGINDKIISTLESINLDEISPSEAYIILAKLKEEIK